MTFTEKFFRVHLSHVGISSRLSGTSPVFQCLSTTGVSFLGHLIPFWEFIFLTVDLLIYIRPKRGYHVLHDKETVGEGAFYTPRTRCLYVLSSDITFHCPVPFGYSVSIEFCYSNVTAPTKIHLIHPSDFSLAPEPVPIVVLLGFNPSCTTPLLPTTQPELGIGLDTNLEISKGNLTLSSDIVSHRTDVI